MQHKIICTKTMITNKYLIMPTFVGTNMLIRKITLKHDGSERLFAPYPFYEPLVHAQNNQIINTIMT